MSLVLQVFQALHPPGSSQGLLNKDAADFPRTPDFTPGICDCYGQKPLFTVNKKVDVTTAASVFKEHSCFNSKISFGEEIPDGA